MYLLFDFIIALSVHDAFLLLLLVLISFFICCVMTLLLGGKQMLDMSVIVPQDFFDLLCRLVARNVFSTHKVF